MTEQQINALEAGDVIRSRSGRLRTVIAVSRDKKGRTAVYVPIMRCSWTHRTYTTLDRTMLRYGFTATNLRRPFMRWKLGRLVAGDIGKGADRCGECCDVVGVFQ